jgi:hypothetical protein
MDADAFPGHGFGAAANGDLLDDEAARGGGLGHGDAPMKGKAIVAIHSLHLRTRAGCARARDYNSANGNN